MQYTNQKDPVTDRKWEMLEEPGSQVLFDMLYQHLSHVSQGLRLNSMVLELSNCLMFEIILLKSDFFKEILKLDFLNKESLP